MKQFRVIEIDWQHSAEAEHLHPKKMQQIYNNVKSQLNIEVPDIHTLVFIKNSDILSVELGLPRITTFINNRGRIEVWEPPQKVQDFTG